jgi:hypothetical protein
MEQDNTTTQPVASESIEDVKIEQPEETAPAPIPYDRFRQVNQEKQQLKAQLEQIERERLSEQGKYKELAEKTTQELESYKQQVNTERVTSAVLSELAKHNPQNVDVVKRLVDITSISVNDDGSIIGVEQAIAKVREEVPQLFTVAPPSNAGVKVPQEQVAGRQFKLSELQDPDFRTKNWEEIEKAQAEGRIDYSS